MVVRHLCNSQSNSSALFLTSLSPFQAFSISNKILSSRLGRGWSASKRKGLLFPVPRGQNCISSLSCPHKGEQVVEVGPAEVRAAPQQEW